ncbi:hypothetical protein [Geodermatophilus sp. URMC 62]|uniref:hypothetical protein n=1 Tax=Geodermatophilus sp. URMC 62 TaxID=3423414 RepID=UPI00406CF6CA
MNRPGARAVSSLLQFGSGAALLARPRAVTAAVAGDPVPPTWVIRLLGGRQVLQQAVVLALPSPSVARAAAVVDGLHAVSMLAAAVVAPRYRRAELTSAAVAVVTSAATALGAPAGPSSSRPAPTRGPT